MMLCKIACKYVTLVDSHLITLFDTSPDPRLSIALIDTRTRALNAIRYRFLYHFVYSDFIFRTSYETFPSQALTWHPPLLLLLLLVLVVVLFLQFIFHCRHWRINDVKLKYIFFFWFICAFFYNKECRLIFYQSDERWWVSEERRRRRRRLVDVVLIRLCMSYVGDYNYLRMGTGIDKLNWI